MEKYAHIDGNRKQTILEHAQGTAVLASEFSDPFRMSEEAAYTGWMHDIGKYSDAFQKRLRGGPKVDHSTAGAYEAFQRNRIGPAFCIAGHHGGLPDGGTRTDLEGSTLWARMNRAKGGMLEDYTAWSVEIHPRDYISNNPNDLLEASLDIRMLYSCLVDADYLDTEKFMTGGLDRGIGFDADELERKLQHYIGAWFPPQGELNRLRCEILNCVMEAAGTIGQGIHTMTIPTGGGKTVASLAFAIKHAKERKLARIIYVIPYTSIIEQTAEVFRHIIGSDYVLEHHSNVEVEEGESQIILRATENWDMPVVVTTAVQFFESFFKNRPSAERKLHNIANSVIVFDEAQMLPVPYLRPCVWTITQLVKKYGVTAVLCTATQPALNDMIGEYMQGVPVEELCPDDLFGNPIFSRVNYKKLGCISFESIAEELNNRDQVLCIVNSRKAAKEIFGLMLKEGAYHLSTSMYPLHRKRILADIRQRLRDGLPCRVISTSLIEAGVDVDFPTVYRQICGLDSILQAGGRCNREGMRKYSESEVFIFELDCGSPEIFSMQISACSHIMKRYDNIGSKEAVHAYFKELFYLKGKDALDQMQVLKRMKEDFLPFASVAQDFNLIGQHTRTVYVITEENEKEVQLARDGFAGKEEYRKLSLYGVNAYEYQYKALLEKGAVEKLNQDSYVLTDGRLYSESTGLECEADSGQALFL